ncbi:unnamed protein product [Victoria cruziana]
MGFIKRCLHHVSRIPKLVDSRLRPSTSGACYFSARCLMVPNALNVSKLSPSFQDEKSCVFCPSLQRPHLLGAASQKSGKWSKVRFLSGERVTLSMENDVVKFTVDNQSAKVEDKTTGKKMPKRLKMSRKAKLSELRFYRLKAKKKMTSPNPEVRIRYKLEKAKRKELWLIEKLRKFDAPRAPEEIYDPEILTEEEKFYLKRTGEKKKNYVPVGRRGVFGGVVLNMHLHWKRHETVKVTCKPCKPGQVHEYAEELARLSKGIVIDIKGDNTIIFYRGKNYVQPKVMSPPDTISKFKALERYKFEQSLEHTSQFIEKLEKELEEYHRYLALYKQSRQGSEKSDKG